ncbi:MAG: FtsQ-type POTRA domain-containing protein [Gemmatimonadota bacterium]
MKTALFRFGAVIAAAALLIVCAVFAPLALRHSHVFDVQHVEVTGVHHLSGRAAVAASGITRASNVFDDAEPWLDALRRHPLVASARIERRLPATLVVHIEEAVPIAFARTPELRAIDAAGRILPTDPADDEMDLPVLAVRTRVSAAGNAADPQTQSLTRFLGIVARHEPGLLGWISELDVHGDAVRLVLRNTSDAEVLVQARPTAHGLRELHIMLTELATPQIVAADSTDEAGSAVVITTEPELSRVRTIDVRFRDQIVVAMDGRKS